MNKKRIISVLAAFIIALATILETGGFSGIFVVNAAQANGTYANLVVIVRFKDDTTGNGQTGYNFPYSSTQTGAPRTYWELLERRYNGINDSYVKGSFRECLSTLSGGKHIVESVFPQTQSDGTVEYITLDKSISEYYVTGSEISMIAEIADKLSARYPDYDGAKIDRDNDGVIDNLTIIASVQKSGQITAHSTNAGLGYKFAGKDIGHYNVLETYTKISQSGSFSYLYDSYYIPTAVHEYIHTFDIPDYYRYQGLGGSPVGMWDLMAGSAGKPSLLAETRERIGWTSVDIKPVSNATYTLYDMEETYKDEKKSQAVKFYTPFSSTEYFVVEYRKKAVNYGVDFDQYAAGDGIIVYRVNPAYADTGNINSDGKDYIYVYRPSDTSISASEGNINEAQLGLAEYGATRQKIGSIDLTKGIVDDAICYSDGRNSGIAINIKAQDSKSITFDIAFADYSELDMWESVNNSDGSSPFSNIKAGVVKNCVNGNDLYTLINNYTSSRVLKYDGSEWKDYGECISSTSSTSTIAVFKDEIYVLISDYINGGIILKKYNSGVWSTVSSLSGFTANAVSLNVVGDKLYAVTDINGVNLQLYCYDGNSLNKIGKQLSVGMAITPEVFDYNGIPAVVYGDFKCKTSNIKTYNGTSWIDVTSDINCYSKMNEVAYNGENTYVLRIYDNGKATITKIDDNNEVEINEINNIGNNLLSADLTVGNEYAYISVVAGDNAITYSVPLADLQQTSKLGSVVYSPASSVNVILMNGYVYNSVVAAVTGAMDVKSYKALDKVKEPENEPKDDYTGLRYNGSDWVYVENGIVRYDYTGLASNEYGWFYIKNGLIDWSYTGLAQNEYGWFYIKNGALDWSYTGLAQNEYGWFYIKNGALDWSYTGLAQNEYGWFYVKNGVLDWGYTGLAQNEYGWFYVKNGMLDWNYTGLAQNEYGWFYIKDGILDWSFTGNVEYNNRVFYVENGKVVV